MIDAIFWIVPVAALTALLICLDLLQKYEETGRRNRQDEGDRCICQGRSNGLPETPVYSCYQSFLILVVLLSILAYFGIQNPFVPVAFLTGGFFSGLCGYLGMKTATFASNRTAWAASKSLNKGLQVALRSGAVMGLVVVGFGLLDIALWFLILNGLVFTPDNMETGLKFLGFN